MDYTYGYIMEICPMGSPYACSYIYIFLHTGQQPCIWGFLKLGVPQVTMVVSILKWSNDLDDLRYPYFRKLPCGA